MNSKDFHENALKTESVPETVSLSFDTLAATMLIAIESANVVDVVKKAMFYGKPIDKDAFAQSLRSLSDLSLTMRTLSLEGLYMAAPMMIDGKDSIRDVRVLHGALGMFTEAGEMVEAVHKYATGGGFDEVNFSEELGDSDWYKAILHDALGRSEEETRAVVIAKLQKRYPGKFDAFAAINRDLAAERAILEGADQNVEEQAA